MARESRRNRRGTRAVFGLLAVVGVVLTGCGDGESPEARLRQTIEAMELAAEEGRRDDFMDRVAEDFSGQSGTLGRQELADMLRIQLLQHSRVHAVTSDLEVKLLSQRATATMKALLTGGPRAWLPDSGQLYRIETGWRMDDRGNWTLISADWESML